MLERCFMVFQRTLFHLFAWLNFNWISTVPRTFVEWARGSGYNYEWFSTINLDEFASCQCDWLFCRWYLAENRVILIDLVDFMNSCWLPIVTETNTIQTLSRARRCLNTDLARHDDSGASRHSFRFIFPPRQSSLPTFDDEENPWQSWASSVGCHGP